MRHLMVEEIITFIAVFLFGMIVGVCACVGIGTALKSKEGK